MSLNYFDASSNELKPVAGGMSATDKAQLDANTENLTNLETYSTDEIAIGTFLGKTLYRKCYYIASATSGSTNNITIDSSFTGTLVRVGGYFTWDQYKAHYTIPYHDGTSKAVVYYSGSSNALVLRSYVGSDISDINIIVEYTKD